MTREDDARIAYEAYADSHGKPPEGGEWLAWPCLLAAERDAWRAVVDVLGEPVPAPEPDGQWMTIAFMGHVELTGYVTEITLGAQAAFHVDLPDKLWGGNPMAWEEYAATALYSRRPVSEESVRKSYEARIARQAAYERQQAEWAARELEPGDGDAWGGSQNPGEAGAF